MIKLGIVGCNGKMGQMISQVVKEEQEFLVVAGVDLESERYLNDYPAYKTLNDLKEKIDVIIDFSNPRGLSNLLNYACAKKVPLVIGTTGLMEEDFETIIKASFEIPIFQDANFSYGVGVINKMIPHLVEYFMDYDIDIIESHHRRKQDAPSGTALLWARTINSNQKYQYIYDQKGQRTNRDLCFSSIRAGTIPGTHTIMFSGEDEIIEIKHLAYSKKIFALGALQAARFLVTKKNGFYQMKDLIKDKESFSGFC